MLLPLLRRGKGEDGGEGKEAIFPGGSVWEKEREEEGKHRLSGQGR